MEPEAGIGPATYALKVRSVDTYTTFHEPNMLISIEMIDERIPLNCAAGE